MNKILVPTDFSEAAQWAVEVATDIALRSNAELLLLHVVEEPNQQSFNVEAEVDLSDDWEEKIFTLQMIRKSKKQLHELASSIMQKDVRVTTELRMGNPYHGMSTIVTEHNVDLVVMGTYGHTKLEQLLVGSNTEKVVRQSKCPVITVHEKPGSYTFKNIVYATAMTDDEYDFARVIKVAQSLYDSTIHVVRINTRSNFASDRLTKVALQDFVERLQLKNFTLNIFNDVSEEEGILHFAESVQADLIGLATHRRSSFVHVLAGSITEELVNHSKKPVLTFVTK